MFSRTIENALRAVVYLAVNSDEEYKINISEFPEVTDSSKSFTAKGLQSPTPHNRNA